MIQRRIISQIFLKRWYFNEAIAITSLVKCESVIFHGRWRWKKHLRWNTSIVTHNWRVLNQIISATLSLDDFLEHEVGKINSVSVVYALKLLMSSHINIWHRCATTKFSMTCYHWNVRYLQLSYPYQKCSGKKCSGCLPLYLSCESPYFFFSNVSNFFPFFNKTASFTPSVMLYILHNVYKLKDGTIMTWIYWGKIRSLNVRRKEKANITPHLQNIWYWDPSSPICWTHKVKVKLSLEQATKAQRGNRCRALLFLQPRRKMGWVVNATPRPLYPRERPGTHCTGGWVGTRAGPDG